MRGRFLASAVVFAAILSAVTSVSALQPDEVLPDPALEARARAISSGLRCVVCQNQSIDDSDAPLARDLRILVRQRLTAGDGDEAVRSFVAGRYGEFVLLKPVWGWHTALLWLGPALIVLAAAAGILAFRRSSRTVPEAALSPEEKARIAAFEDAAVRPPSAPGPG